MEINIQIRDQNDTSGITGNTSGTSSSVTASVREQDGGAANHTADGSSTGSRGDAPGSQLDIGGPPQWLYEAIKGGDKSGTSSSPSAGARGGEIMDAGAAPEF